MSAWQARHFLLPGGPAGKSHVAPVTTAAQRLPDFKGEYPQTKWHDSAGNRRQRRINNLEDLGIGNPLGVNSEDAFVSSWG